MKKLYLLLTAIAFATIAMATESIRLTFNRGGTNAESVSITIADESGNSIQGATATLTSSHTFKGTGGAITAGIICPNVNGKDSPTIKLTLSMNGLPSGFAFDRIGAHIHALNGSSNYQETGDGVVRQWNITAKHGPTSESLATFGSLSNIDIAAGISGANKMWEIEGAKQATSTSAVIELTITKGTTNSGCFFGLSEIALVGSENNGGQVPETPATPDTNEGKIYNITWKTTSSNYITEGSDKRLYIGAYSVTERQFWQLVPSGKANRYYIKNTATGNYIGSCNKTPSSASKISTSTTPVEYYVGKTTATSGEIAGCYYFSSTDCSNYDNEASGPRALNKDGASNYIITWQAGTSHTGSYWTLVETEDLYEIRPFEPSSILGNIETSYNISSKIRNITLAEDIIYLADKNPADTNQGWYFVGNSNREGYLIASTSRPTTTINIANGNIVAGDTNATRWKVYVTADASAYYFKSIATGQTLIIDGDSLLNFSKQRNAYARNKKIYNNPCGYLSNNYITNAKLHGDDILGTITYEATAMPANWHVLYTTDKGEVAISGSFGIDITLAKAASNDLEVYAYFDWNADGIFETTQKLETSGNKSHGTFTTPEWAANAETRMRVRVNENGLNYAEDDVEGVVYDFIIKASPAMQKRTVTVGTNAKGRGNATLSSIANEYEKGTSLTATATTSGNNSFICWKEGNIIVSTDAEYTFTVDHNIALTAYFTPDTANGDDIITSIDAKPGTADITITASEGHINATSSEEVKSIAIYNASASLISKAKSDKISTAGLPIGIYIVKVRTATSEKNFKFYNR